jgi:hypothetical protein
MSSYVAGLNLSSSLPAALTGDRVERLLSSALKHMPWSAAACCEEWKNNNQPKLCYVCS